MPPIHAIISGCLIALPILQAATPVTDYRKFDIDRDGFYDPSEQEAILKHQSSAVFAATDLDYDGKLSAAEKAAYFDEIESGATNYVLSNATPGQSVEALTAEAIESSPKFKVQPFKEDYWPLAGVQLRRSLIDIDTKRQKTRTSKQDYAKSLEKVAATELAFARNGSDGNENWSARGVLARPFLLDSLDDFGGTITPYVQFDRLSNSVTTTKDLDSLIFGLQGSLITNGFGPVDESEFRLAYQHATNFDFDRNIHGGALDWQPTLAWKPLANGVSQDLLPEGLIRYRTRQYLHIEGGHSNEQKTALNQSDYLRTGIGAGIVLMFSGPLERLNLTADYRYYWDVLESEEDFHNFRATANWKLDTVGHLTLQASYESGLMPLSHEEVDLFSLGFGVKF